MAALWRDRAGRFSTLRAATLAVLVLPGLFAAIELGLAVGASGPLVVTGDARPVIGAIHEVGDWAVRFLLVALAITPAARIFHAPKLIGVRRMVGVAAFSYAATHFALYVVDQKFDLVQVASEIVFRIYLTIGFVTLLGLSALAATSTDAMVRRLGVNWRRLHRLAYPLTALALLHFYLQSKIDVSEPVLMTGFFLWLMGWRAIVALRWPATGAAMLAGLALAAAVATGLVEAGWYAVATGVPADRVLAANLGFAGGLRPAWWVLIVGLAVAAAAAITNRRRAVRPARTAPG